jgi:hypothetical protein
MIWGRPPACKRLSLIESPLEWFESLHYSRRLTGYAWPLDRNHLGHTVRTAHSEGQIVSWTEGGPGVLIPQSSNAMIRKNDGTDAKYEINYIIEL